MIDRLVDWLVGWLVGRLILFSIDIVDICSYTWDILGCSNGLESPVLKRLQALKFFIAAGPIQSMNHVPMVVLVLVFIASILANSNLLWIKPQIFEYVCYPQVT